MTVGSSNHREIVFPVYLGTWPITEKGRPPYSSHGYSTLYCTCNSNSSCWWHQSDTANDKSITELDVTPNHRHCDYSGAKIELIWELSGDLLCFRSEPFVLVPKMAVCWLEGDQQAFSGAQTLNQKVWTEDQFPITARELSSLSPAPWQQIFTGDRIGWLPLSANVLYRVLTCRLGLRDHQIFLQSRWYGRQIKRHPQPSRTVVDFTEQVRQARNSIPQNDTGICMFAFEIVPTTAVINVPPFYIWNGSSHAYFFPGPWNYLSNR